MIQTDRLIIRPWQSADAEALYRYASDNRVSDPGQWPRHTSVEMSRQVIERYFLPNPDSFAIVDKATGEAIGCIGLVPMGEEHYPALPGEREVGYWLGFPFWGRGIMPEALMGLIDFFRSCKKADTLLLTTLDTNHSSRRVAEKCGFSFVCRYNHDGKPSLAFRRKI